MFSSLFVRSPATPAFVCLTLLLSVGLTGCGGSSSAVPQASAPIPSASDREAPVILAQSLDLDDQGQALVTRTALGQPQVRIRVTDSSDDKYVAGWCLAAGKDAPAASDACFVDSPRWEVSIGPAWHAWARDAAGNVSKGALSPGPCSAQAYAASAASSLPTVCMMTDQGEIVLELESKKASNTVTNFLAYVSEGFYAGTVFHRVLPGSVLQGGGFSRLQDVASNRSKPTSRAAIALEGTGQTGLSNLEKTVAMARTTDPNSATSQFFINLRDNARSYDAAAGQDGYAVFGRVIYGYETAVRSLASVPLGGTNGDLPQQALFLQWAYAMK